MMLGKRPRPPMRRTTSMTEFAGDIVTDVKASVQPAQEPIGHHPQQTQPRERRAVPMAAEVAHRKVAAAVHGGGGVGSAAMGSGDWLCGGSSYMASMVSPRGVHRRNSGDFQVVETAPFLRNCGLCKRRLGPGRDIFMYRGDTAFCSLECRQQQMNLDEKKEKCSLTSRKDISSAPSGSEQQSGGDGTVAAA